MFWEMSSVMLADPGGMQHLFWQRSCCVLQPFRHYSGCSEETWWEPDTGDLSAQTALTLYRWSVASTLYSSTAGEETLDEASSLALFWVAASRPGKKKKTIQKHCCVMMQAALELRPSLLMYQWRSIMLRYLGARTSYNWVLNRIFVSISARRK